MTDGDLDRDMHGWLQSEQLDATADYVKRGRQFELLPIDDLKTQWASTFRDTDAYMNNLEVRALSSDYGSEFALRGIKLPMEEIKTDFAKIQRKMKKMLKAMSDQARADLGQEIADDLDAFRSQRNQNKQ
jgi:hypothetical protein